MISFKSINKCLCTFLIFTSIVFMIYGILRVNYTLPQVVRPNSSFNVTKDEKISEVIIDIGEYNIILKAEPFKNFIKGISVLGKSIKDML